MINNETDLSPLYKLITLILIMKESVKTKLILSLSAIALIASVVMIGCSDTDEKDVDQSQLVDGSLTRGDEEDSSLISNDTIILEFKVPTINELDVNAISADEKKIVMDLYATSGDASPEKLKAYKLKDKISYKHAIAVEIPGNPNAWLYECYSADNKECVRIIFEQISDKEFVTKDENGHFLRKFIFDPERNELWTYNQSTRGRSMRDKLLCNGMFAAACFVFCEALAVPSGGWSLLVGIGFAVASTYIC